MTKTIIYFVRHGEVENPKKILYGRFPGFSLSKKGIEEAEKVARKLNTAKISIIYTSPLLRARQTAKIIGRSLNLSYKVSKLLNEIKTIFQGVALETFNKNYQKIIYNKEFVKKGNESIEEIAERMMKFVKQILKKNKGKIILAVSHGDPIMILKAITLNRPFTFNFKRKNYIKTGQIVKLVIKDNKYHWQRLS